jgi:hypothetical protein
MPLPNYESAHVEDKKIKGYLLNLEHEDGRPKANFFFRFGFTLEDIEPFRESLLNHAEQREVDTEREDEYGVTYTLVCEFETPDNRNPCIRTVWILNRGEERPRLVTAYPEKK